MILNRKKATKKIITMALSISGSLRKLAAIARNREPLPPPFPWRAISPPSERTNPFLHSSSPSMRNDFALRPPHGFLRFSLWMEAAAGIHAFDDLGWRGIKKELSNGLFGESLPV